MAEQINDGGFAFPSTAKDVCETNRDGMTLRDWFAGQAIAECLRDDPSVARIIAALGMTQDEYIDAGYPFERYAAMKAYRMADAMLLARGQQ